MTVKASRNPILRSFK
jgi:hypothetical protein